MWPFSKKLSQPSRTKEERGYTVIPWVGPPLEFMSTTDLCVVFYNAMQAGEPACFKDDDGQVVASYAPGAICTVIRGIAADSKKNEKEKK